MTKKNRTFLADDEQYEIIKACARSSGRSISEFVLHCALSEAKRRTPVEELKALVHQIVLKEIKTHLPATGNGTGRGI